MHIRCCHPAFLFDAEGADTLRERCPVESPWFFFLLSGTDQVIRSDVVERADVGMVQSGDSSNLAVEAFAKAFGR